MYYKVTGLGPSRIVLRFLFMVQTPGAGSWCTLGTKSNQTFYGPERVTMVQRTLLVHCYSVVSQCYDPDIPL